VLILLANNIYSNTKRPHLHLVPESQDAADDRAAVPDKDAAKRNCFIWIAMVAIESWRTGCFVMRQGRDLMLMQGVLQYYEMRDWETVEDVLKTFLWYEPLGARMKACWEERIVGVRET